MSDNIKILRNYLLYFLSMILVCIVGISNVFADTFNPSSALQYYEYYSSGTKQETSIQYGNNIMLGSPNAINYPYAMSLILYGNYLQDKTYTLNVNIDTYFESNYFKFYYENLNYLIVSAQIVTGSERTLCNLQPITQNQSYSVGCTFKPTSNLSQVILSLVNYDYQNNGYVPFGSGDYVKFTNYNMAVYDNSSNIIIDQNNTIINQNNQNTQSIINNNNTNTENIINNQNQNTQEQIESQKVCNVYDKGSIDDDLNKGFLNSSGVYFSSSSTYNYGVSKYINIYNSNISILSSGNHSAYSCFYNVDKEKISCIDGSNLIENTELSIPNDAYYIRLSIQKSTNKPTIRVCKNGNQALDDSITGLNDSLNDDDSSGATSEASEFFSSFTTNTFGLTSIITAPLNLIQSLTSSTCSELHLPLPYLNNKYLDLPCMTSIYQTHFGAFFTMYQTITYGIIAYWVCVRIFNQVKDFKNPEHDEIEVVDL